MSEIKQYKLSFFRKDQITNMCTADFHDMQELAQTDSTMLDLLQKAYVYYLLKQGGK